MRTTHLSWLVLLTVLGTPALARPCSVTGMTTPERLVGDADAIVRVVATGIDPDASLLDGRSVRFSVLERLKGDVGPGLTLPGRLTHTPDVNDRPVPYTFVRRAGRHGSCSASEYQAGGAFLLLLKKNAAGRYTTTWAPLAPVNEQLRDENDPWLGWVRARLAERRPH